MTFLKGVSWILVVWASVCFGLSEQALEDKLKRELPMLPITSVRTSSVDSLYEVASGANVFYATKDGRFFMQGEILDLTRPQEDWNITEEVRRTLRLPILSKLSMKDMVIYTTASKPKAFLTIFTDVDCHYCKQLHQEVAVFTKAGVEVRYAAFPRMGLHSSTYENMISVWCSEDPSGAMALAMAGKGIPKKTCEHPIDREFILGQELGIRATPTIFLEDGTLIPGYVKAEELIKEAVKHAS